MAKKPAPEKTSAQHMTDYLAEFEKTAKKAQKSSRAEERGK